MRIIHSNCFCYSLFTLFTTIDLKLYRNQHCHLKGGLSLIKGLANIDVECFRFSFDHGSNYFTIGTVPWLSNLSMRYWLIDCTELPTACLRGISLLRISVIFHCTIYTLRIYFWSGNRLFIDVVPIFVCSLSLCASVPITSMYIAWDGLKQSLCTGIQYILWLPGNT